MKNWIKHCSTILKRKFRNRFQSEELNEVIETFIETCSDHQLIDREHVENWIKQFNTYDKVIPVKVLSELRYYSGSVIQTLSEVLIEKVYKRFGNIPNDIFYIPIGRAGSGSHSIARALIRSNRINNKNVIDLFELHVKRKDEVANKILVFLDDFSGSGRTIKEWWEDIESLVLPLNATICFGVLIINYKAIPIINKLKHYVFYIEYLKENMDMFNEQSEIFADHEKETLLKCCIDTGCPNNMVKGYEDCGLMISFQHGCPNNSLPILWYDRKNWTSLFHRRNIG